MPRKKKEIADSYNKPFPKVLRKLMDERKTTQTQLAKYLNKTRQAVAYYCDGSSSPDLETLNLISSFFGISADYLLGRTNCPAVDPDLRAVCDYTGLSAHSVEVLKNLPPYLLDIVNFLVSHPLFQQALWSTERASRLWMDYQQNESSIRNSEEDADGEIISAEDYLSKHFIECMPYDHASELYMEDAKTKIGTILQQIVNGQ